MKLDEKDKKLLNLLQKDSRESLTNLAKALDLSIDSTHKRIKKLTKEGIIYFKVFIDPKKVGYELIANIQIKLSNLGEDELVKFVSYLEKHPRVIELISIMGTYDLTCVIIAKDTNELEGTSRNIREDFRDIIADWRTVINLKVHKFEEYDFSNL